VARRDASEIPANPEKEREARIKRDNEEFKRQRKEKAQLEGSAGNGNSRRGSLSFMTPRFLEEGLEEDGNNLDSVNLTAIKKGLSGKSFKAMKRAPRDSRPVGLYIDT